MHSIVTYMGRARRLAILGASLLLWPLAGAATAELPPLEQSDRHAKISRLVTTLFERSHYRQVRIDDSVSSRVLDRYIEVMDGNRHYFLASDIEEFEAHRHKLDDAVNLDSLGDQTGADALPESAWVRFDDIPLPFGQITADPQQERRITHGQTVLIRDLDSDEGDWVKLVNSRGRLIAVGVVAERIGTGAVGVVQPRIVFS